MNNKKYEIFNNTLTIVSELVKVDTTLGYSESLSFNDAFNFIPNMYLYADAIICNVLGLDFFYASEDSIRMLKAMSVHKKLAQAVWNYFTNKNEDTKKQLLKAIENKVGIDFTTYPDGILEGTDSSSMYHNIFDEAVNLAIQTRRLEDKLDSLGIFIEYNQDGRPAEQFMSILHDKPFEIACAALGLKLEEDSVTCESPLVGTFKLDVYYPENYDHNCSTENDFSITFEGLWDLLEKISQETEGSDLAETVWDCFAESSKEAKNYLKEVINVTGFVEEK